MDFKLTYPPPVLMDGVLEEVRKSQRASGSILSEFDSRLILATPHRVYVLRFDQIAGGDINVAECVGWRALLYNRRSEVVAAVEFSDDPSRPDFGVVISRGHIVQATADILAMLEQREQNIGYGPYEVRLLRIPSLAEVGLWFTGGDPPMVLTLHEHRIWSWPVYAEAQFLNMLQELMEQRTC